MNFLQKLKDKDKLLHQPASVPETAKDIYGDISSVTQRQVVEDRPPSDVPPTELPSGDNKSPVKFVDRTIESAKMQKEVDAPQKFASPSQPYSNMSSNVSVINTASADVTNKPELNTISEPPTFGDVPKTSTPSEGIVQSPEPNILEVPTFERKELKEEFRPYYHDNGFFRDFQKFLNNKDMSAELISDIMNKDLLHKMKQFHIVKDDGSPFYFHAEDSERALVQKLEELKLLEEEWYIRHKSMKESQSLVLEKEAEIDLKLEEFKKILQHIKQREKIELKAPMENYFNLEDGGVLRSISDLREALKNMKDRLYDAHVTNNRNDFATWIEFVFGDRILAEQMRAAPTRKELIEVLYSF